MALVPYTGWRCLGCGHMTDYGFPVMSCCPRPVVLRVLVREPGVTTEQLEALRDVRWGRVEVAGDE